MKDEIDQPPEKPQPTAFVFKREEDLALHTMLEELIGQGAAQLFQDACFLLDQPHMELPSHRIYLIGHLLREMGSSVLGVIKPLTEFEPDDAHEALIKKLELPAEDPVSIKLQELLKNNSLKYDANTHAKQVKACLEILDCKDATLAERLTKLELHKHAHRKGLRDARLIDDEFRMAFREVVYAYRDLLLLCEAKFPLWHRKVDELIRNTDCPRGLQSELPRNSALLNYLFIKLDNPQWFDGLKSQGFFECNRTATSQHWPQVHYLVKIAERRPQEVLEVLLAADTQDLWLYRLFTEAALRMPKEQAETWAKHVDERITSGLFRKEYFSMGKLSEFLHRLIELESEEALSLLSVILDILPNEEGGYEKFLTRMNPYEYREFLENIIPRLAEMDALRIIEILDEKLKKAIEYGWPRATGEDDRSSAYWLSAIEDHPQNDDHDLEGSIAISLRKVLETSIERGGQFGSWQEWLNRRASSFYIRMGIHLVRCYGSAEEVRSGILNEDQFNNSVVIHEYLLLLKHGFGLMTAGEQKQLLSWIEAIPGDEHVPEEFRDKHRKWQQYRRLSFVRDHLNEKWKSYYDSITPEDDADDLDRLSFDNWMDRARFVEHKSPLPAEEIAKMPVQQLVEYLLGDIPVDRFKEITERGLEQVITEAVSKDPAKYTDQAALLRNPSIKPVFIRGFTSGFIGEHAGDVDDEVILSWLKWCIEQPAWQGEHEERSYETTHNDNKKVILRYLDNRMTHDAERPLPIALRGEVFEIIRLALQDPDPDPEDVRTDYHGHAINSVRGSAMESALQYGLWIIRDKGENTTQSLDDVPELRDVLDERLDLQVESSPAVRSCFGFYLPQLCWIDGGWVSDNLMRLFPEQSSLGNYFDAVWETYLMYGRCYNVNFDVLKPVYTRVVSDPEMCTCEEDGTYSDSLSSLAHHLVLLFAWERFDVSKDSLLCRFIRNTDAFLQEDVLSYMGKILLETEKLPDEVPERFKAFYEWWLTEIAPNSPEGWKAFPKWFRSPFYERDWKIKQLAMASKHGSFGYESDEVLGELSGYISEYTEEAISVLEDYVNHQLEKKEGWMFDRNESLFKLLELGHKHSIEAIRIRTDHLLGRMVGAGYLQFRDIWES